jgi:ribosomal protein L40E
MNPLVIYLALVGAAIAIAVAAMFHSRPPTRSCPRCDDDVAVTARGCRSCGYAFT